MTTNESQVDLRLVAFLAAAPPSAHAWQPLGACPEQAAPMSELTPLAKRCLFKCPHCDWLAIPSDDAVFYGAPPGLNGERLWQLDPPACTQEREQEHQERERLHDKADAGTGQPPSMRVALLRLAGRPQQVVDVGRSEYIKLEDVLGRRIKSAVLDASGIIVLELSERDQPVDEALKHASRRRAGS